MKQYPLSQDLFKIKRVGESIAGVANQGNQEDKKEGYQRLMWSNVPKLTYFFKRTKGLATVKYIYFYAFGKQ